MSETQAGSSIRRSSSSRAGSARKPKPNQLPFAILVLLLLIAAGIALQAFGFGTGWYMVTGLIFGYILQRSRFCFTASMRDPCLTGTTLVTRDRRQVYRVYDGIPVLLAEEALATAQVADFPPA